MKLLPIGNSVGTILSIIGVALAGMVEGSVAATGGVLPTTGPSITGIQLAGNSVIISASVPPGIRKVTLQSSRSLGTGAWEPRAVMRLDGTGGVVTFELPKSPDLEIVRVRADESEALPSTFYRGTNSFPGIPISTSSFSGSDPYIFGPVALGGVDSRDTANGPEKSSRDVVESDIWKVSGDTLYFFNQYRGLQVIDVSTPDAPVIRGTLSLPAAGEQMYLLSDNHVVLLARAGCNWGSGAETASQVLIVRPTEPAPTVVATLPLAGDIQESRLVGTALYVMTQNYRAVPGSKDGAWEWGTRIFAFDLSDPTAPIARESLWYSGYGNMLSATDRFLFVSVAEKLLVHCVDISVADGTLRHASSVSVAGQVMDKFKMHLDGEVLTVISESWSTDPKVGRWRPVTILETFSLADPSSPRALGRLKLADGERLHATRFDDKRVYVVTFLQVDPLWVVDLTDPAHPAIKGELHVPGWSTYIQPYGDRLVAMGIDNTNGWRVAVSLFDVHDPAAPALLSKVPLGENSSWSEANSDEKAFGFLPDDGLILVPFSTYTTNSQEGVQLIDFHRDSLTKRGFISHDVQARRSTLHRDRVLSLSGQELLSVDASDRDRPVVRSNTELAWPVNRVFVKNGFLVEVETSSGWANHTTPALRVVSAAQPNHVLNLVPLSDQPVAGATYRDGRLYLLQGSTTWIPTAATDPDKGSGEGTNQTVLVCSVVDLTKLPALEILSSTKLTTGDSFSGAANPVWPKPELLVWVAQQPNYWRGWYFLSDVFMGGAVRGTSLFWPGGFGETRLYAVDVSDPKLPEFRSEVTLTSTNGWASFSQPYAADGSVFLSRQLTETSITGTNEVIRTNVISVLTTNVVLTTNAVKVPHYTYETNLVTATNVSETVLGNKLGAYGVLLPSTVASSPQVLGGGTFHSLAIAADGQVWTWGDNGLNQLGEPGAKGRAQPKAVAGLSGVRAIASGLYHSLALPSDGSIWTWGDDAYGQLGDGRFIGDPDLPPTPEPGSGTPVRVAGLNGAVVIGAGDWHSFAVRLDGSIWAWGGNADGQLGDGTYLDQFSPVRVTGLENVSQITGGRSHSIAIQEDGTVWAWGGNDVGQLGDGSHRGRNTPWPVSGLREVTAIAAGHSHTLALRKDGTVWSWGLNANGQLGDGTLEDRGQPQLVAGLDRVVAIACGPAHSLALRSDGSVWAWGRNKDGQLNGLASVDSPVPVQASQVAQAATIAAGGKHSLAVNRAGDSISGWGSNEYGQLGSGTILSATNTTASFDVVEVVTWVEEWQSRLQTNIVKVPQYITQTNAEPIYTSRQVTHLHVVDYTAPATPVSRQPIAIPGALRGLSHNGSLLYLVGYKLNPDVITDGAEWLHACAYDGVATYLVDSHALPVDWPHAVVVHDGQIFVSRPESTSSGGRALEVWSVTTAGRFEKLSERKLSANALQLVAVGNVMAVQEETGVELFSLGGINLPLVGAGSPPGCLGWDLSGAAGSLTEGLWLPLGEYGVYQISTTP